MVHIYSAEYQIETLKSAHKHPFLLACPLMFPDFHKTETKSYGILLTGLFGRKFMGCMTQLKDFFDHCIVNNL